MPSAKVDTLSAQERSRKLLNKVDRTISFLAVIAAVSFLVALGFLSYDFLIARQHFPRNSYVGKVEVSGLTVPEAVKKLRNTPLSKSFEPMVYFNASAETFTYTPEELGIFVKVDESVNKAFFYSKKESYLKDLQQRLTREVFLSPLILDVDIRILEATLADIASRVESVAQNAKITLDEATGAYHISPDYPGRKLKIQETIKECRQRLLLSKNVFPLILQYYEFPKITEDVLRIAPPVHQLSRFTTYYGSHDSPNRIHNIKLIASWLNDTVILSGESFSLVNAIGNFTPERGFKEAYVIMGGALIPQYGGGTCQIGTTLYNVAALADLQIISRRNHSFYFSIYPLGRDATVYPGQVDLKFSNNTSGPILIKTLANDKLLRFTLYGTPTGKRVEFSEPKVFLEASDGFVPSTSWRALKSGLPFRTIVERKVYDKDGQVIKTEEIRSFYRLYGDSTNVRVIRREGR